VCLVFRSRRRQRDGSEVPDKDGPLFTAKAGRPAICATVLEANQLGLEYREDVNDVSAAGGDSIGWFEQTRLAPPCP
jgi:hypothetical protein